MTKNTQIERLARLEEQGKNQSEVIKSLLKKIDLLPDRISDKMDLKMKEINNHFLRRETFCREQNLRLTNLEKFKIKFETGWKWVAGIVTILAGVGAFIVEIFLKNLT